MKLPKTRDYPKKVIVGGEDYKIKFVRKIRGESENTQGLCDPDKRVISIKLKQSMTETFQTFIHEILHAMEFEYDITIPHEAIYAYERALADYFLTNF